MRGRMGGNWADNGRENEEGNEGECKCNRLIRIECHRPRWDFASKLNGASSAGICGIHDEEETMITSVTSIFERSYEGNRK